jgi:hypothetical protein
MFPRLFGMLALVACLMAKWSDLAQVTRPGQAIPVSNGEIPTSVGWWQVPNTQLQSVCPPNNFGSSGYAFQDACHNVVDAWGGGVADTLRSRLILWGGGHSDYLGNEVYQVDFAKLKVERLTNPTVPLSDHCAETLPGPAPNSRHTYDGLVYIPSSDVTLAFGGALAPTGCSSSALWQLDMKSLAWTFFAPYGTAPVYDGGVVAADHDPNTGLVFVSTESYGSFASYDYNRNAYTILNNRAITDYHETAVIDSKRRMFFLFGGGSAYGIDLSDGRGQYKLRTLKATGCGFITAPYPGVAFDLSRNLVVGWAGGDAVYLYDPDKDSCSSVVYPNGPGPQQANGTLGRFRYLPALNLFVLVNSFTQNAYTLRLNKQTTQGPASGSVAALPRRDRIPSATKPADADVAEGAAGDITKVREPAKPAAPVEKTEASSVVNPARSSANTDEDFQARCHTAGVIKCVGWDDPSDFLTASGAGGYADGLYPAFDGTLQGTMDTHIKTSGAGALKFTIRPNAVANATGYWRANFGSPAARTKFGPHTTLYIQFRLRLDENLLNFNWAKVGDTGWKVFIVYGPIPGPSCTGAQFVQENTYQRNIAIGYTSCGAPALYSHDGVPPMLVEQGDYKCPYSSTGYKSSSCFQYPPNTWLTEYWVVQIGDFGQPNTHFTAYIAPDGQPLKRFIDLPHFKFNSKPAVGDALETMLLQPYLSGADGSKPNPTAHMWFDELIVSTQPIAPPKY